MSQSPRLISACHPHIEHATLHPSVPRDGREKPETTLVLGNLASQHGVQYNDAGHTGGWGASLEE